MYIQYVQYDCRCSAHGVKQIYFLFAGRSVVCSAAAAGQLNTQVLTKVVCPPTCVEYTTHYYLNMLYHFPNKI